MAAGAEQVSCNLSSDAVILHLNGGVYYGLDGVGGRVWSLIRKPRAVREVRDLVLSLGRGEATFRAEPKRVRV